MLNWSFKGEFGDNKRFWVRICSGARCGCCLRSSTGDDAFILILIEGGNTVSTFS